ncbi:MAG: hypothetical protein KJ626_15915 [Verrucomicrobia bacterium]|nr:hypothetical protein [Verrucomicrobiota bacterium]
MKSSSTSNSRRWPKGLLLGLLILAIGQPLLLKWPVLWEQLYRFSMPFNDDPLRVEAVSRLARAHHPARRVLIVGSSQAREDFDIKRLNGELESDGIEVLNVGMSGGGPPIDMYMMMDEFIELEPDLIVYMPYFGSFYQSKYDYLKFRYYFDPRILPWLKKYVGYEDLLEKKEVVYDLAVSRVFPLYRYREFIQRGLMNLLTDISQGSVRQEAVRYALTEIWTPERFEEYFKEGMDPWYEETSYTALNRDLFGAFAENLKEQGVTLLVIDGPSHAILERTYTDDLPGRHDRFLRDEAARLGYAYISLADMQPFTVEDFADFTHLNERGRQKLTTVLLDYLRGPFSARTDQ